MSPKRFFILLAVLAWAIAATVALSGCAEVVDHPECRGKLGRHVLYDGAPGWTSNYIWSDGDVDFTPEGVSGGKYAFGLRVPCTAVTPIMGAGQVEQ